MKKLYTILFVCLTFQYTISQVTNDTCSASENIAVTTTSATYTFDINNATLNNEVGCSGTTAANYADVWYDFTMPVNGNLFIDAGISWNAIALYDLCNGTEIQCGTSNELFTNLTATTNYKIRIFRNSATAANTGFQSFSIIAFEQVSNDICATAQLITVAETETNQAFDIGGADINNEVGCSGTTAEDFTDIWYKFTMPVDGKLNIDGDIAWNNFALFSACNGMEIDCGTNEILFENLTQNTEYFLRVFRNRANSDNNSFRSFSTQVFAKPNNDNCTDAINLNVTTTEIDVDFEIGGADVINEVGCVGTPAENLVDVWYDFTMPFNGNVAVDSGILWNRFALYDSCAGTQLDCDTTDAFFTNLTQNTTYKLRVFRTEGTSTNNSFRSFKIRAFETVTNDTCSTSETITVTETDNTIPFDIGGASLNNEVGCSSTTAEEFVDIWYEFSLAQNANVSVNSPINWNNFALYDACSGTEINCANANGLFENLNTTTTYKLRVFRPKVFADDDFRQFTIKIETTLTNTEFNTLNDIKIHPNPTTDQLNINLASNNRLISAHLYNILGKEILNSNETNLKLHHVKTGIYLLKLNTVNGNVTKKLIINR